VVGKLNVREGKESRPAILWFRLMIRKIRANRDIVVKALNDLGARQARRRLSAMVGPR